MVPHSSLPNYATLYELWHSKLPDYDMLKPFGCLVWTHVPKPIRRKQGKIDRSGTKVQPTAADGCFVEHISFTQYKVYSFTECSYFVTDNLLFREDQFPELSKFDANQPPLILHDMIIV